MADKQRILITGANGQLGKELKELCSSYPGFEFIFLPKEDLPIQNFEIVRSTFTIQQPQYCINCAAYTAVDQAESEKDLAFLINGESVGVLAAVCKEHNTRFIHISTDYVFDGNSTIPYKETDFTNPLSVYGASKLEGENQTFQFNEESIIIRTSWVYSEFGKNFVKTMLRLLKEKEEISVVNDQVGSPTYAADLANTILQIISTKNLPAGLRRPEPLATARRQGWQPGIYHYSNEGVITWYDLAMAIKKLTGSKCRINPIPTSQYPTSARRPLYSVLDKIKIQETFGISLKNWEESLSTCIEKLKKHIL
jgi:dTDP-4-dehydrorhamnose reductase